MGPAGDDARAVLAGDTGYPWRAIPRPVIDEADEAACRASPATPP